MLTIPAYNKYAYIIKHGWIVNLLYIYAILSWLVTLIAFYRFFHLSFWYALFFSPIVIFFTFYQLLSFSINLFYKTFNLKKHHALVSQFWDNIQDYPSIDIFLPICGEETEVLERTFSAVTQLHYPAMHVYVLDDKGNPDHQLLASNHHFTYLSRENKGHMKKAGNLKYGYQNSTGEFIIIFDADFAPHKDFIREILPYMEDNSIGILQTPQYFDTSKHMHKKSMLEFGAGQVQEDFYRIIQVSRDYFGAAICVGSNAVYRRKALDTIGGTAQIEHSEDVHTGFNLLMNSWKIKYIPIILSIGLCPSNMHAYFHQQHRWCSGSMSLMSSKKFWSANIPLMTKLCFLSGFMFYISHVFILFISLEGFLLLFWNFKYISFHNSLLFFPLLSFTFIVMPLFRKSKGKYGSIITRAAYANSYIYALFSKLSRKSLPWMPTGIKTAKISTEYKQALTFNAVYLFIYVGITDVLIARHHFPIWNINYSTVIFWILYFIIIHSLLVYHSFEFIENVKKDALGPQTISYYFWWFRTAGVYIILITFMTSEAIFFNLQTT